MTEKDKEKKIDEAIKKYAKLLAENKKEKARIEEKKNSVLLKDFDAETQKKINEYMTKNSLDFKGAVLKIVKEKLTVSATASPVQNTYGGYNGIR